MLSCFAPLGMNWHTCHVDDTDSHNEYHLERSDKPMSTRGDSNRGVAPILGTVLIVAMTVTFMFIVGTLIAASIEPVDEQPSPEPQTHSEPEETRSEQVSETNITLIGTEAALVLGGLLCLILIGRSSRFWNAAQYGHTALQTRLQDRRDDSSTPIEEITEQYANREIDEATLERRLEEAMEDDPTLAGVPSSVSDDADNE